MEKIKLFITYFAVNMNLLTLSWSKLQHKYNVSHNTIYTALTGKGRPGGSQYQQKRKWSAKQEATAMTTSHKAINN